MKYLFMAMGVMFLVVFTFGLVHRMQTGEIVPSYYPSQILMWITFGVSIILGKIENRNSKR